MKPINYVIGTAALIGLTAAAAIGLYKLNESRKPQYMKTVEVNGENKLYFISKSDSLNGKPFAVDAENIAKFYNIVMEQGKNAFEQIKDGQSKTESIDEKVK